MFIENFRQNDNIALRSRFVNMRFSLFDENQWISDRERSPAEKSAAGAGAGGRAAVLTCVERRGPLCPIASGDRLLCRNALRQRHGFGDARPLRGAVFLRIRATDRVRCAAKFHFADAAVSLRVQIASGGQGASPLEPDRRGAGAGGGFAALTCVERRGPLCPIASGDRLLCRNALRQRHGFGDARPLRGAVFLRIRATDRVRCAAKFHFADAAVSLRVQIASGGQGASPLEPDRRGAGAGGGFAALTRLTDNVLCLYSRSEYGTLRKKNFRTESIARYSFSSPSSAKPCG